VPEFPAPAIPIASPCASGGYHRDANGSDTAKEAPAMQEQSQHVDLRQRVDAADPCPRQPADHQNLTDDSCRLGADPIDGHAHEEAREGPRKIRQRHHESLLGRIQIEILGDRHSQRPEQDPDHERDVEVEERREESRGVSRFHEFLDLHGCGPRLVRLSVRWLEPACAVDRFPAFCGSSDAADRTGRNSSSSTGLAARRKAQAQVAPKSSGTTVPGVPPRRSLDVKDCRLTFRSRQTVGGPNHDYRTR